MSVTSSSLFGSLAADLAGSNALIAKLQQQIASGSRLSQPSDDPVAAAQAVRLSSAQGAISGYQSSATDATRFLGVADSTLGSMTTALQRVAQLATSAVNATNNASSNAALSAEITSLRDQLVSLANADSGVPGQSLFGGFSAGAVAQVAGSWTYTGDSGAVNRQIDATTTMSVNDYGSGVAGGADLFGFTAGAGNDVFSVLDQLASAVAAGNPAGITAAQTSLSARSNTILAARGVVGAQEARVTSTQTVLATVKNDNAAQLSTLHDTDVAQAALQLSQAQTGYEAALSVAARVGSLPSLVDFLR
ncbi:MAG TPA: flagellar hook-associated protein FlgL [Mycobacteriales bacterium]|nr:flagellar hook-associated protein FlgL [Mycobacteriales bacterium]